MVRDISDNHSLHAKELCQSMRRARSAGRHRESADLVRDLDCVMKNSLSREIAILATFYETFKHHPTTRTDPPHSRPRAQPLAANPRLWAICADSGNHSARFEQSCGTAGQGHAFEGSGRCGQCHRRRECPRPFGSDDRGKRTAAKWNRAHPPVDVPRPQPDRTTEPVARGSRARHHEYSGTAGR